MGSSTAWGTNDSKPEIRTISAEDSLLWVCNKWLLVRPDSAGAMLATAVRLAGYNIDIANDN